MKWFGLTLVLLGVLALSIGGVRYNQQKTILKVGSLQATATEEKHVPMSPIVGGIALISGITLLALRKRHMA